MKYSVLAILLFVSKAAQCQLTIGRYLTEVADSQSFSGSVVVAVGDEIILKKGFGMADHELQVQNTSESVHRIGSLTKQFTSMGILKLFDESDSLSIHDPLVKFIPNVPGSWDEITIFHLLTHTSGIPNYFGDMDAVPVEETYLEIEKVMEMDRSKPSGLKNVPGEEFRYSNFGYVMLGRVIEVVSGLNYFDYLKKEIFDPLGMNQTFYDDPRPIIPNRSQGYKFSNDVLVNDALKDPAGYSAGGMLSSADDMLKWMKALNSDVILKEETCQRMFTPKLENYGLGWQILEKEGRTMYNHNGGTHGYNSRMVYYPQEEVFIAVLGNNEDVRSAAITCDIEALIFNEQDAIVSLAYNMDKTSMVKFVGQYSGNFNEKRILEMQGETLFFVNGESKYEITPIAENVFCFARYKEFRVEFSDENTFTLSTCSVNPRVFVRDQP